MINDGEATGVTAPVLFDIDGKAGNTCIVELHRKTPGLAGR
jgi:hypothetical protein